MPQIFVFAASKPEAQRNLVISIEHPIDEAAVLNSFASAHREELERTRGQEKGNVTLIDTVFDLVDIGTTPR